MAFFDPPSNRFALRSPLKGGMIGRKLVLDHPPLEGLSFEKNDLNDYFEAKAKSKAIRGGVNCKYFPKCGGCDYLDLSEEKYQNLKKSLSR